MLKRNMEQTLLTKDIIRIYHQQKARRKLFNLSIIFCEKHVINKQTNKGDSKQNGTLHFQLHNIVQNKAFPCVFTAMSSSTFIFHTASFPSVKTECGQGLTISVLKYIYIYNFSFSSKLNKNVGRSI